MTRKKKMLNKKGAVIEKEIKIVSVRILSCACVHPLPGISFIHSHRSVSHGDTRIAIHTRSTSCVPYEYRHSF